ncbi:peptide methionine sulfoxide reductase [Ramicandelaber brevisporus]|nr:peptide methionine sulfoxide reductase [Ramicandelaber brevisporus]
MSKQLATFAAGCFWSVELLFQRQAGVLSTRVGYTAGKTADPTYKEVCTDSSGHAEAVQLEFDPSVISYDKLLSLFWGKHNPTTLNRQGGDIGTQYRSAIFYHSDEQRVKAEASKAEEQKKYTDPIVTEIEPAAKFYNAEEYHQAYLEKGGQSAAKGCTDPIRCYG